MNRSIIFLYHLGRKGKNFKKKGKKERKKAGRNALSGTHKRNFVLC